MSYFCAILVATPGTATPVSPQGENSDYEPVFTWLAAEHATYYYIWVVDAQDALALYKGVTADDACTGDDCQIAPGVRLDRGDYRWRVRAGNPGASTYSDWVSFRVGPLPGVVRPTSPQGDVLTTQPAFNWENADNVIFFRLQILDPQDTVVLEQLAEPSICETNCELRPFVHLLPGDYHWRVRGENLDGVSPWSEVLDFTVWLTPGAATPISPEDGGIDAQPTYTWGEAAQATQYRLQVIDAQDTVAADEWFEASDVCATGTCTATPTVTLAQGEHRWRIRTQNPSGLGPWSTEISFIVGLPPGAPTPLSPQGAGIDAQPTYTWEEVADAAGYRVMVRDASDTVRVDTLVEAADACSGGVCSTTPDNLLEPGSHSWQVQAENAGGASPWSASLSFSVEAASGAPVQIDPLGTVTTAPVYHWESLAGMTSYRLVVYDEANRSVVDNTYAATDICQSGICQTAAGSLAEGEHRWWVRAGDDYGNTPWSAGMSFTAVAPVTTNNWHYIYDGLSRVTYACSDWDDVAETCAGDAFNYEYDGAGNLTRFDKWNADTSQVDTVRYVINGANQIQCIDLDDSGTCNGSETLWEYDAFGNLTDDGTTTYTYDAANRVSSITTAAGTTTYSYNGDGDRIAQEASDGTLTTYVLDTATPLTMVLSETNASTGETTQYWHALDTLAQSDGTTTEYFAYDGLGSVRQLVDETGSVGLAQTFDPYGSGYATSGSASSSLGWTGEQVDANGFVYLRARYYAPGMGRFTQMDPSRLERNAYQYSAGNPILNIDPSGLRFICPPGAIWCNLGSLLGIGNTTYLTGFTPQQAVVALLAALGIYACSQVTLPGIEVPDLDIPLPTKENYSESDLERHRAAMMELMLQLQLQKSPQSEPEKKNDGGDPPIPVCVPGVDPWCTDDDDDKTILYHYGTASKIAFILSTRSIPVSDMEVNPTRARHGTGVYFTELTPGSLTKAQLARYLYGNPFPPTQKASNRGFS